MNKLKFKTKSKVHFYFLNFCPYNPMAFFGNNNNLMNTIVLKWLFKLQA